MEQAKYQKLVEAGAARSHILRDCLRAYFIGGMICVLGQALGDLYRFLGTRESESGLLVSVTLIFLACLFTGIGWFDSLAKYAGGGTLVPITGFANAISSPAIDCKNEGLILGVGAKMFTIAGPVIVYGIAASAVYGVIYWACCVLFA